MLLIERRNNSLVLFITFFVFILLVTGMSTSYAVESICPGGSNPDPKVVFCDDFDDGSWLTNPTWGASPYSPEGKEAVECGSKGFNSPCAAYSGKYYWDGQLGYDGRYGGKYFSPNLTEMYMRVYIKFSSPFNWSEISNKGLYFEGGDSWNIKMEYGAWGTKQPSFASYAMSPEKNERFFQNQGKDISFIEGRWYLVEYYLKLNTGDNFDGVVKLWVDDASVPITKQTLRLSRNDIRVRKSSEGDAYYADSFFISSHINDSGYVGPVKDQWIAWDQFVISAVPIGPIGEHVYGAGSLSGKSPSAPVLKGFIN